MFSEEYGPDFVQAYPLIHELEALNLVIAVRTLRPDVSSSLNFIVKPDKTATTPRPRDRLGHRCHPHGLRP